MTTLISTWSSFSSLSVTCGANTVNAISGTGWSETFINQQLTKRPITFCYSISWQHLVPIPKGSPINIGLFLIILIHTHTCTHVMYVVTKRQRNCGTENRTGYWVTNLIIHSFTLVSVYPYTGKVPSMWKLSSSCTNVC